MWRSKKFVLLALLAAVLLVGSIGGVAFAQTENGDESQPKARSGALLDKVCEIYNANPDRPSDIDCDILKAAFAQARSEMRPEAMKNRFEMRPEAMQNRLQNLIDEGKITQEQIDALKEWREARPDLLPDGLGFKGRGGFRGMGEPCVPPE